MISLGFQDADDEDAQEEVVEEVENVKIDLIKCLEESDRWGHKEVIKNSEVRNERHNDCDDLLELQLQPKGKSS